jgi:hypothetical protein
MGKLNVKNGTPVGNANLCKRCTWGQFMTGFRDSDLLIICTNVNPNLTVPFPVNECSGFNDRHKPTLEQMSWLALRVSQTRLSARTRGFYAVTKLQPVRVEQSEAAEVS